MIESIIRTIGMIHSPFSRKKITGKDYYLIRDKIEIGTVLLSTTYGELSNIFNPEEMKHGAIYVGDIKNDKIMYVAESRKDGFVLTDLVSFLTSKDEIVLCAPKFLTKDIQERIQITASSFLSIPYDYNFRDKNKAFYCFEAIAQIFYNSITNINLHKKKLAIGRAIYSCDTYMKDKQNFEILWD